MLALIVLATILGMRFVHTDSLPRGIYWIASGPIHRGAVVTFCLPASIASEGVQRGYIRTVGSWGPNCPEHAEALAKLVAASEGDHIDILRSGVYINGQRWPLSSANFTDTAGRDLHWRPKHFIVSAHQILLMGINRDSWDARYFGTIPVSNIRSLAYPIVIEASKESPIFRKVLR